MPGVVKTNFSELELRATKLTIKDASWWEELWEGGTFEVKLITAVSDGVKDGRFNVNLDMIPMTKDGPSPFGSTGYRLYRNPMNVIPRFLDINVAIIEDDSDIRNTAKLFQDIKLTDGFKEVFSIVEGVGLVTNPIVGAGVNVAATLINLALEVFAKNEDDLWLRDYVTRNRKIDGYGGREVLASNKVELETTLFTA